MILANKLNLTDQSALARAEEELSKRKAKQLFDLGDIEKVEVGTYAGLAYIHGYLFDEIYHFSGKLREVNMAKGNFRFASVMFLKSSLEHIDNLPHATFDQIVEKYVEINVAHPFREGNGRATRIWLDLIFKQELQQVVDWNQIEKEDYLMAMQRSPVKDIELKHLLKNALTSQIHDREVYLKGIDISYYYEGYTTFKTEEL